MSAALLRKMHEMGLTMEQAIELMEAWEGVAKAVPELSAGALRTRKWRQKQAEHHGDVTVTRHGDDPLSPKNLSDPSSTSELDQTPIPPKTPLTGVKKVPATGSRLPDGWEPDDAGWAYAAQTLGPDIAPQNELDRFRDYWRAVPGAKGRKLDWPATWRNWCRTTAERLPTPRKAHERPYANPKSIARDANMARAAGAAHRVAEEARRRRDDGERSDPHWEARDP